MAYFWKIAVVVFAICLAVTTAGLVGGLSDVSVDSEGVKNALQVAVVEHNRRSNDAFVRQASRIIKAQSQVVAGIKYYLTVEMARTQCRKGGSETVCPIHQDANIGKPFTCEFQVWSRPWMNQVQVTKDTCSV